MAICKYEKNSLYIRAEYYYMNRIVLQHIQYAGYFFSVVVVLQNNGKSVVIIGFCRICGQAIAQMQLLSLKIHMSSMKCPKKQSQKMLFLTSIFAHF